MSAPNVVEPVVTDIDPDSLALQAQLNALLAGVPAGPDVHTPEGLAVLRANTSPPQGEITSARSDVVIAGPGGALRLHIIRPPVAIRAVMLRIHGGGFVAGAPEDDDTFNDSLARAAGLVIVSPEYRLVPEATMADGVADCVAAATWLFDNAAATFGTSRLLVAGNSAGATHAAQTVIHLRDLNEPAFKTIEGVVLDCGLYDIAGTPSALAADADTLILPRDLVRGLADLGSADADLATRRTAAFSPLYADLAGLPPAYFLVGDLDPLSDDSRFMAARWQAAGNRTDLDV
ncbi:MAG TPA: alpha/beta hydrolase fold domain-containing protein, partial [Pseudonocardia sp.]